MALGVGNFLYGPNCAMQFAGERGGTMEFENGHLVMVANQHTAFLTIGQISLTFYGLAYAAGFAIGWSLFKKMLDRSNPPMTMHDDFGDLFFWTFLGVVVGGRLGYIL